MHTLLSPAWRAQCCGIGMQSGKFLFHILLYSLPCLKKQTKTKKNEVKILKISTELWHIHRAFLYRYRYFVDRTKTKIQLFAFGIFSFATLLSFAYKIIHTLFYYVTCVQWRYRFQRDDSLRKYLNYFSIKYFFIFLKKNNFDSSALNLFDWIGRSIIYLRTTIEKIQLQLLFTIVKRIQFRWTSSTCST